jgi:hypothetical protein
MSNENNTLLNEYKRTNFDIQPSFEEILIQNVLIVLKVLLIK